MLILKYHEKELFYDTLINYNLKTREPGGGGGLK